MYADKITDSMQYALDETQRRRDIQTAHNENMESHLKQLIRKFMMLLVPRLIMMKQMKTTNRIT